MKKQIALLATIIAASGLTAFGQDWVTFGVTGAKFVWDETTTPGAGSIGTTANEYDVIMLWAPLGTSDQLPAVGTEFAQKFPAVDQVATNGVTSLASPFLSISNMLSSGWSVATNQDSGSGTAATGLVSALTTANGGIATYNSQDELDLLGGTGVSSASGIEMILLAYNASAGSWLTATDIGWSNPVNGGVGSNSADNNGSSLESADGLNGFGVSAIAAVPEPTTLALAGLGGLSMLFLRRRNS